MALIQCPECGKIISEYAEMCVGCGCPMRIIESLNNTYASKALGRIVGSVFDVPGPVLCEPPEEEYLDVLDRNLSILDQIERDVLKYRTGLSDTCIRTYEEIGVKLKIAPSDVYMYESAAYEKLGKIHPLFSTLRVMAYYPKLDDLKKEAVNRGYIPIQMEEEAEIALRNVIETGFAFDVCCRELLEMYHPSSVHATPIDNLRINGRARRLLEKEKINTIGNLVKLSNTEVLEILKGSEDLFEAIQNELSLLKLGLRDDSEESGV